MKFLNFRHLVVFGYIGIVILLFFVLIVSNYYDLPLQKFTADPTATLEAHPLTGLISNIGVLFWCATATICLFSFTIISPKKGNKLSWFLLFSGLFSLILLADDLFLLHENILPYKLNIHQKLVYVGYAFTMSGYIFFFWKIILGFDYKYFIISILLFGASIICDLFLPIVDWEYFLEDSLKIFGIFSWFLFYARTSQSILLREITER